MEDKMVFLVPSKPRELKFSTIYKGDYQMNFTEKKEVYLVGGVGGIKGRITLNHLAKPETVKVTVQGEPLIPECFDVYGHPIFTAEQAHIFAYKQDEQDRRDAAKPLRAEITYEDEPFAVPASRYDTAEALQGAYQAGLARLNELIDDRRRAWFASEQKRPMNWLILLGKYSLDSYGQLGVVENVEADDEAPVAEYYEDFVRRAKSFSITSGGAIPQADERCPCCGKWFTADDLVENPCTVKNDKFYHARCWREYCRGKEIHDFTRRLMWFIYKDGDYTYDLLPNEYWGDEFNYVPWFMFHTPDGDIKMGWRKRVISIEWQENYKEFDLLEMFEKEEVTKWDKDGKRGIHAWGKDKAQMYLETVRKKVNPNYKPW